MRKSCFTEIYFCIKTSTTLWWIIVGRSCRWKDLISYIFHFMCLSQNKKFFLLNIMQVEMRTFCSQRVMGWWPLSLVLSSISAHILTKFKSEHDTASQLSVFVNIFCSWQAKSTVKYIYTNTYLNCGHGYFCCIAHLPQLDNSECITWLNWQYSNK